MILTKKTIALMTMNKYIWVYDSYPKNPDGSLIPVPVIPGKVEYTTSSPVITDIGFNWGWGISYNNHGNHYQWFSLTSDWINNSDPDEINWDISRSMIYNFSVINN